MFLSSFISVVHCAFCSFVFFLYFFCLCLSLSFFLWFLRRQPNSRCPSCATGSSGALQIVLSLCLLHLFCLSLSFSLLIIFPSGSYSSFLFLSLSLSLFLFLSLYGSFFLGGMSLSLSFLIFLYRYYIFLFASFSWSFLLFLSVSFPFFSSFILLSLSFSFFHSFFVVRSPSFTVSFPFTILLALSVFLMLSLFFLFLSLYVFPFLSRSFFLGTPPGTERPRLRAVNGDLVGGIMPDDPPCFSRSSKTDKIPRLCQCVSLSLSLISLRSVPQLSIKAAKASKPNQSLNSAHLCALQGSKNSTSRLRKAAEP